jgi:hypothetical protein
MNDRYPSSDEKFRSQIATHQYWYVSVFVPQLGFPTDLSVIASRGLCGALHLRNLSHASKLSQKANLFELSASLA